MLRTRLITALFLIPSFLAALFLLPEIYWALLGLAVISVGLWEWAGMAGFSPNGRVAYSLAFAAAGLLWMVLPSDAMEDIRIGIMLGGVFFSAIFWILAAPIWLATRHHVKNLLILGVLGWLVIMPTWLALIGLRRISPWLLLAVMATVWLADSAAYFSGKKFGKHKLAPLISPGKTWEGVWGAWLGVTLYGLLLCWYFHLDYWLIAGLWLITVLSIMGDLLESLIKRQAGVKDSSNLLPGHGGILDRIDGLTSSLPLVAFFIYFPLYRQILLHWQWN